MVHVDWKLFHLWTKTVLEFGYRTTHVLYFSHWCGKPGIKFKGLLERWPVDFTGQPNQIRSSEVTTPDDLNSTLRHCLEHVLRHLYLGKAAQAGCTIWLIESCCPNVSDFEFKYIQTYSNHFSLLGWTTLTGQPKWLIAREPQTLWSTARVHDLKQILKMDTWHIIQNVCTGFVPIHQIFIDFLGKPKHTQVDWPGTHWLPRSLLNSHGFVKGLHELVRTSTVSCRHASGCIPPKR